MPAISRRDISLRENSAKSVQKHYANAFSEPLRPETKSQKRRRKRNNRSMNYSVVRHPKVSNKRSKKNEQRQEERRAIRSQRENHTLVDEMQQLAIDGENGSESEEEDLGADQNEEVEVDDELKDEIAGMGRRAPPAAAAESEEEEEESGAEEEEEEDVAVVVERASRTICSMERLIVACEELTKGAGTELGGQLDRAAALAGHYGDCFRELNGGQAGHMMSTAKARLTAAAGAPKRYAKDLATMQLQPLKMFKKEIKHAKQLITAYLDDQKAGPTATVRVRGRKNSQLVIQIKAQYAETRRQQQATAAALTDFNEKAAALVAELSEALAQNEAQLHAGYKNALS